MAQDAPAARPAGRGQVAALAVLVFLVTAAVFWPAGQGDFLAYDDVVYVTGNARVRAGLSGQGLSWALSATDTAVNWHPLTWLAHMLDVELFGLDARAHHLSSVFWHALAAALFFIVLSTLLGSALPALAGALLFALHPQRVEAVAQIADRKDLLAGVFGAATLSLWLAWRHRGGALRALSALACFAAGLAAKPTLLAWPAVLWLADRPPFVPPFVIGGPVEPGPAPSPRRRLAAVAPFALLAAGAGALVLLAQVRGGALRAGAEIPLGVRLANACAALTGYARDFGWPRGLCFFYPHPALVGERVSALDALLGGLGALLVTLACWRARRRLPALWLGWSWCLVTLGPTLGLVQVGLQARADRYTYLPAVGLSLALGSLFALVPRRRGRALALGACCAVLVWLAAQTRAQISTWRDTRSVMEQALSVTENNFLAHANLAAALELEGRWQEALEHLELALAIRPAMPSIAAHAAHLRARHGAPALPRR
jgi:tetratricopeptide (TPR) repeat protein